MKMTLAVGCALLFMIGEVSPVFATAAVEYGIISGKPAPGSGIGAKLGEKMDQVNEKSQAAGKPVQKMKKEKQGRSAGKGSGPLIMERRGDHFERIN